MHFACDFCTALEILAFTLEEFVKGEKTAKGLVFDHIKLISFCVKLFHIPSQDKSTAAKSIVLCRI